MYLPCHFTLDDPLALQATMHAQPFATLVTITNAGLTVDHLPLLFDPNDAEHGVLRGHIARANPLWREDILEALAIFHGPQHYITPAWYPAKREHGRVVPTWNYLVVHARGRLAFIEDPGWLKAHVAALAVCFEKHRAQPWSIADAPQEYIDGMCRGIIGLELTITGLTGKHKASQHRDEGERTAIYAGLQEEYGLDADDAATLIGLYPLNEKEISE
ncbi:FMN-binding negative transcriptional regulator [Kushneria phosphatilytica]|uniref:FMN-binding negative transcriptional regulator n=1 Tax=Kushneria phosphatilytica TaxID=657387 RepID=A0A1S1NTA6_9GAMM|nr:FMN-binding negative transcriptional regulator [Kushneria phosphatilytica]OHV08649.1 transcriptional regulator [Kushneria phosphatilytica]QEL12361.1 FMN-binding negative transcriptional regulator [Kushneria phosphatilytica]